MQIGHPVARLGSEQKRDQPALIANRGAGVWKKMIMPMVVSSSASSLSSAISWCSTWGWTGFLDSMGVRIKKGMMKVREWIAGMET